MDWPVAQVTDGSLVPGSGSSPVAIAVFLLVALAATAVLFFLAGRLARLGYRRAEPVATRLDTFSPLGFPTGLWGKSVVVVVGALLVGSAIYLGLLGAVDVYRSDGDVLDDGGPERIEKIPLENDAVVRNASGADVDGQDTDGDGLPDAWERAGETPDGVPLPGADPRHKDLYVQVNHGIGSAPLTDEERADLERIWAELPVENPDGGSGITLHLVDEAPRGGALDVVGQVDEREGGPTRYYTDDLVGDRRCVYHQVVVGRVTVDGTVVLASTPGHGVVVDGRSRTGLGGSASWRVYAITHGLLHNVVGERPDGRVHTGRGWLSTPLDPDDDHLTAPAASLLSERGFRARAACAE